MRSWRRSQSTLKSSCELLNGTSTSEDTILVLEKISRAVVLLVSCLVIVIIPDISRVLFLLSCIKGLAQLLLQVTQHLGMCFVAKVSLVQQA